MDGQQEVIIEGRSLECKHWARVSLALVDTLHELSLARFVFSLLNGADAPVNESELTFVGGRPEGWRRLIWLEQYPGETKFATLGTEDVDGQVGDPTGHLTLGSERLKFQDVDVSGIPDVHKAILRARDEMIGLAIVRRFPVNFDMAWHELDVGDVAFVRLIDVGHDQFFHLLGGRLVLLFLLLSALSRGCGSLRLLLLAAFRDLVLRGVKVPRDELSINATANQHLRVLR